MAAWLIPMRYIAATLIAAFVLPRLEQAFLPGWGHGMSIASALAFFAAVNSGMLGLIGIVFAISFVVVQFGALAYSPRFVAALAGGRYNIIRWGFLRDLHVRSRRLDLDGPLRFRDRPDALHVHAWRSC